MSLNPSGSGTQSSTWAPVTPPQDCGTKELFKTRVENGILGDMRFDKNGDPVEALVTIRRIVRPSQAPNGSVADRVVIGRAALLR